MLSSLEPLVGADLRLPTSNYLTPRQTCQLLNCSEYELYLITHRFKKLKRLAIGKKGNPRYRYSEATYVYRRQDVERLRMEEA
jgi:hypothetical protein